MRDLRFHEAVKEAESANRMQMLGQRRRARESRRRNSVRSGRCQCSFVTALQAARP
eukprot:SAG11_NODE_12734_length_688_cov_0.803056_2_plen_56_part_00